MSESNYANALVILLISNEASAPSQAPSAKHVAHEADIGAFCISNYFAVIRAVAMVPP